MAISRPHNWLQTYLVSCRHLIRTATDPGGLSWELHFNLYASRTTFMSHVKLCFDIEILSDTSSLVLWLMSVKCACSLFLPWETPGGRLLLYPKKGNFPTASCTNTRPNLTCYENDLGTKCLFLRWTVQERNRGGRTELPTSDQRWRRASRTAGKSVDPEITSLYSKAARCVGLGTV